MNLQQERLACIGVSVMLGSCVLGAMLDEQIRVHRRPMPRPHPKDRVTVYDLDAGQVLLWDRPFVLEERYGDHRYFFRFQDGGERFLDLRGTKYRIIRRKA